MLLLDPLVDERDQTGGKAQADADSKEGETSQALGEAEGAGKDERVAVQEGEEHNIDHCEIESNENDDRFAECEDERSIKCMEQALEEADLSDLNLGFVPVVTCQFP